MLKSKKTVLGILLCAVMAICCLIGFASVNSFKIEAKTWNGEASIQFGLSNAPASKTISDILPDDFPVCDDGVPADAWDNGNGTKLFIMGTYLSIHDEDKGDYVFSDDDITTTTLTKDVDNNYKYTKDGVTITFTMDDNVLLSIEFKGLPNEYAVFDGTYTAPAVAKTTCPTCGGDGLAQCSECFGRGCDACKEGDVPCTDCGQTGKISFTTLEDAISEVTYYGKITLLKDNSEEIEISKATVFIIDKATFTFDKSKITAGTGYDVSTIENETETTFIITLQKTIADIIATNPDFPTSNADAPANAWVSDNGHTLYSNGTCLYSDTLDNEVVGLKEKVIKSGDTYYYTHESATITFNMVDGVLTSIDLSGTGNYTGSYAPAHVHNFTYSAIGNVITATCDNADGKCELTDNKLTLTLTAPLSFVYDGKPKAYTFADGEADAWTNAGLELPTIFYNIKQSGQSSYLPLMGTLKFVGDYMAQVTVDGKTASVQFNITKAEVDKPQEDTTVFTYNGNPQTYNIAPNDLYSIDGNEKTDAGNYIVTVSLNDKANYKWAEGTTDDLTFNFIINQKVEDVQIKDENKQVVENPVVSIIGAENGIAPDAVFVVKVMNIEKAEDTKEVESLLKDSNKISENEKIYGLYDAKLVVNDVEIQPNGNITVKMLVPEELRDKEFKLYHIHNGNEVIEISYSDMDTDGFITFTTDKLSEFAFVGKNANGLSTGALIGIIAGACVVALGVILIIVIKKKKSKK